MDALPQLARCPLFASIPASELETLLPDVAVRHFPRGAALFHEDDPATRLFVVVSGSVKISRTRRGGDETVLTVLTAGDLFGELALFDLEPRRSGDAEALEATDCLSIAMAPVRRLLEAHPEALTQLVARMGGQIRHKDEAFSDAAYLDIPGRVASKLLELAGTHGRPTAQGLRIEMRLSQRVLAGMIGASRENVNRALTAFTAQGAIRQDGGVVTILDAGRLRARV